MRTRLVVDNRERESRLLLALQMRGVPTAVRRLVAGDYIAGLAVVERKSVGDLHLSIIERRFWLQISRLSRTRRHPYLLVEGTDLHAGAAGRDAARQRVFASRASSPQEAMLAAVPGISVVTAHALLSRFGSVAAVLAADPSEWLSIRGVGPKRARALTAMLAATTRTPSRAPSARPDPST